MDTVHTVDILVTDGQRRVLLVERGKEPFKGKLVLPGGHIEPGESPAEAAIRELREETGLVVDPARLHYLIDLDASDRDPRGKYVSHVYGISVPSAVLESARAGSDAARVVLRDRETVREDEMGFDHYDAILLLHD